MWPVLLVRCSGYVACPVGQVLRLGGVVPESADRWSLVGGAYSYSVTVQ